MPAKMFLVILFCPIYCACAYYVGGVEVEFRRGPTVTKSYDAEGPSSISDSSEDIPLALARAALMRWLAAERSLRAVEYIGATYLVEPGQSFDENDEPFETGSWGEHIDGSWYAKLATQIYRQNRAGEEIKVKPRTHSAMENGVMRIWDLDANHAIVSPEKVSVRNATITPMIATGSRVIVGREMATREPLPARMLRARTLQARWDQSAGRSVAFDTLGRLLRIAAKIENQDGYEFRVVVWLDPSADYMPRTIQIFQLGNYRKTMELAVEQYERIDGVLVAVAASRAVFYEAELPQSKQAELVRDLEALGVSVEGGVDLSDPEIAMLVEQVIRSHFGEGGLPVGLVGNATQYLRVDRVLSVNSDLDDQSMLRVFDEETKIFNQFLSASQVFRLDSGEFVPLSDSEF